MAKGAIVKHSTTGSWILAFLTVTQLASSAPALRKQVDQRGDFLLIGNTLGHDCGAGTVAPVVGTVGNCGNNTADSSPDIFWRSQSPGAGQAQANNTITVAQARSTAMLTLPPGATVTYARLYWAGDRTGGADTTATLDRPGGFTQNLTADASFTLTDNTYQSTVDVTALIQAQGSGAYRISGVDTQDLVNLNQAVTFNAWWMVVFYEDFTQPPRNLALFDGLDLVNTATTQNATLSGFLVPNAGFTAKLGVITYEGDNQATGDELRFGPTAPLGAADRLSDAQNPLTNFFNSTRSNLGNPVSVVGDLPQLAGTPQSMSSFDMDIVDVTSRVSGGQTSAAIQANSNGDVYYLGAFITSISTFRPDFTGTEKLVQDLNGGAVLPGDVLEYTINVVNNGNDTSVNTVLADVIPAGVTFVPGSIQITSGANAGTKTDAAGDDQAEYAAGTSTVTVRLGVGANAAQGGTMPIGGTAVVKFRVTVNAGASGTINNQANITASGQLGAPSSNWPSDGNGAGSGTPPTPIVVDQCATDANCPAATPHCYTAPNPNRCVECFNATHCGGNTPLCNAATNKCQGCVGDFQCSGTTPACQPSGACGQCSATNTSQCTGTTPFCNTTTGTCFGCTSDAQCSGNTPACQPSGLCGQCSATNTSQCTGTTPACDTGTGTCVGCTSDAQCSNPTPKCDTTAKSCVQCLSNTDCSGLTPTCSNAKQCVCVATGAEVCGNGLDDDCNGTIDDGCKDTDGDGLSDDFETSIGTDPNDADSDDDGLLDGEEPKPGEDSDGDGLINALDPDSDNDGLFDGTEMGKDCTNAATDASAKACRADADAGATTTDPLNADSDGGGVSDGAEDANLNGAVDSGETDPVSGQGADDSTVVDSDKDGLSDALENFLGSNPNDADSDDDGLLDGDEPNPSHDTDGDGLINLLDVDSDNDALFDGTERGKNCDDPATNAAAGHCRADGDAGATMTSALLRDTDGGGVSDGSEDFNLDGVVDSGETDPTTGHGADDGGVVDSDGDGLSDGLEATLGTDPNDADSDDDGLLDGDEPNPSDDHDGDGKINALDEDSDGDGLFDGTEAGRDCSNAATDTSKNTCRADADPTTTTGVLQKDTDKGGVDDGEEDANKDGKVDAGETDPNDPSDDLCASDADCGTANDGLVCDDSTKHCVDGCRGVGDGAGCPSGQQCTSTDASIGQCVPTGTGGAAGSGGSAGSSGSGGSGGSSLSPEGLTLEGGGCGCSAPRSSTTPLAWLLAAGVAIGGAAARRRRRNR
ncbi:MAG: DUF3344 domain-containing protein [Polyangiaceae bacterium]